MPESPEYDCVIVGGGPAGMSCALELREHKRSYVLLEGRDRLGGQLDQILNTVRNLAAGFFENGLALRQSMVDLAGRMEVNYLIDQHVTRIDGTGKTAWVGDRAFKGKTLVIATGASMRLLEATGVDRFLTDIIYRTELAEDHLYGRTIAVVGGGDSALMEALLLAEHSPRVYVVHRGTKLSARADVVRDVVSNPRVEVLLQATVARLHGSDSLSGITVEYAEPGKKTQLAVDRLVVKIGYRPHTDLLSQQTKMDARGFIITTLDCETSIEGVYAVGDIVHPGYLRIAPAMGQGVAAAVHIGCRLKGRVG